MYYLTKLKVPRLQLCEYVRWVIFFLNGVQSRLVGWTITRENVLLCSSVVLIDISVIQLSAFCERDAAVDKIGCEFHDAVIILNICPCDGDVDY